MMDEYSVDIFLEGKLKLTAHGGQLARSVGSPEMLVALTTAPERVTRRSEPSGSMMFSGDILDWL